MTITPTDFLTITIARLFHPIIVTRLFCGAFIIFYRTHRSVNQSYSCSLITKRLCIFLVVWKKDWPWFSQVGIDTREKDIAFQNSLPNSQKAEELAKDHAQLTENFNLKWKKKEYNWATIPTTFSDEPKLNDHLTDWKKGNPRCRRYTFREAAQADEENIRKNRSECGTWECVYFLP